MTRDKSGSPHPEVERRVHEALDFRYSLTTESDQGCALLAGSYLDGELEKLLRSRLVDDAELVGELLRPDGPLGSFSARIDTAYLLGCIGAEARRDLHLIRKIRNQFGHSARRLSFTEPSIAARCREMRHTNLEADSKPRHLFTNSVMGVAAVIHIGHLRCQRIEPARDHVPDAQRRAASREMTDQLIRAILEENPPNKRQKRTAGKRGRLVASR